jgi:hypothetical protein
MHQFAALRRRPLPHIAHLGSKKSLHRKELGSDAGFEKVMRQFRCQATRMQSSDVAAVCLVKLAHLRDEPPNQFGRSELSMMPKTKPTSTGPMRTQPTERGSIMPTQVQPMMPTAGKATKSQQPKQQLTRTEAVRAAKARITRRNSLRKQRDALKG